MNIKTLLLASAAVVAFGASAQAADPIMPAPVVPPVVDYGGFDWNGFYAGVNAGAQNEIGDNTSWSLGGQLGVNAAFDFFLVGAEVGIDGVFDTPDTYAYGNILARGGVIITDELLAYGAVGYGTDFGAATGPGEHVLAGGGLEFAVTDDVTLRGQYLYGWAHGATTVDVHKFTIGANFHF